MIISVDFLWLQILAKPIWCDIFIVATENEVIDMRGRPKKEITRDIVYKVRLNAEEDQMLTQASEWTGQAKPCLAITEPLRLRNT